MATERTALVLAAVKLHVPERQERAQQRPHARQLGALHAHRAAARGGRGEGGGVGGCGSAARGPRVVVVAVVIARHAERGAVAAAEVAQHLWRAER